MTKESGATGRLFGTWKGLTLITLVLVMAAAAGAYWSEAGRSLTLRLAARLGLYEGVDHELVAVRDTEGNILHWTCSMHPWVKADADGQCPICGMDLVAVQEQPGSGGAAVSPAGHEGHGGGVAAVVETVTADEPSSLFSVSPERQQLIGVRFAEVARRSFTKTIRTVGRVEVDERGIAQIHTKISGWVEKIFVDFTWKHVAEGDPLFTIYSPELVSTQEEYLLALKARERLGQASNPFPRAGENARSLADSARARLELWDVTPAQIAELERTRTVQRTLTVYSPISGHVMERMAFPQTRVTPDMNLYTIADHSNVWVYVDIYENEIRLVRMNQKATMTVPAYPNENFTGSVAYIDPHVQADTRTLRVRLEFSNPDLRLKPGMYADLNMEIPLGSRLAIPKDAVLRTGAQDLVFVDRGAGQMQVRLVQLGVEIEDMHEVVSGLRPGERVVSAANFLIDAESQVQGAVASWERPEGLAPAASSPAASPATAGLTAEIVAPRQASTGTNAVEILVRDSSGQPVDGAEVNLTLYMPAMGAMAPMSVGAGLRGLGGGRYRGTIDIPTAFSWQTTITVQRSGQTLGTVRGSLLAH